MEFKIMLFKIFLSNTLSVVSILAISGILLGSVYNTNSRAMEECLEEGSKEHIH